jgi:hypothetical protein
VTNQEHKLEGPSGFVPLIAIWNIAIWPDFGKWRVQEGMLPPSPLFAQGIGIQIHQGLARNTLKFDDFY